MSKKIHKKRYPYGRFMWKCRKFNSKSIEEWIDRPVNVTVYLDHMVKYGKVTPKNWMGREFFNSRSVEKWMEIFEWNQELRVDLLPQVLKRWVGKYLIDSDQAQHLKDMFLSPDKENWLVAITIMKSIAKKKKRR